MRKENMNRKTAFYIPNLGGGGAQRVIINLARGFIERGLNVDVVVAKAAGPLLEDVPVGARLVDLGSRGALGSLPRLVKYMKRERPAAMLSTMSHCNVVALLARWFSRSDMRLIVREATTLTFHKYRTPSIRERTVFYLMNRLYPKADMVVANSLDTAADLVRHGITSGDHVRVIHNPIVSDSLLDKQKSAIDHPWFRNNDIPVVLGIGRLHEAKDYETMIRAFSIVRKDRTARLLILGEGAERGRPVDKSRGTAPIYCQSFGRCSLLEMGRFWKRTGRGPGGRNTCRLDRLPGRTGGNPGKREVRETRSCRQY